MTKKRPAQRTAANIIQVIFTDLIGRVEPPTPRATRTLILAHRRELVEQAAKQCRLRYPEKTVEIEMGNLKASGVADITVASIQSIHSQNRSEKFNPADYKLILVDEAHHIVSKAYLEVLEHFGISDKQEEERRGSTPALVGVSATLSRLDGVALGKVIKHIVYHKDYVEMIGEKWLSNVIFTTVSSNADLSKVRKGIGGDFSTSQLSRAVNQDHINLITVKAWQNKAEGRKSTIVFCVDLDHVDSLTTMFRQHGIDARFVSGDTPKKIRSDRLDAFKRREFPVLVNCGVFTEGTDIPNIDCVLLARPTKSRNLLVQMIGRGMRLHPGKENCHIIDMVASLRTGIVTTPTLFGLDPSETITNMDPEKLRKLRERKETEKERQAALDNVKADPGVMRKMPEFAGSITFTSYETISDLIEDSSGERFIRAISPNAWVNVGTDKYILQNGTMGDWITLERISPSPTQSPLPRPLSTTNVPFGNPSWKVTLTSKLSNLTTSSSSTFKSASPYARPRVLLQSTSFEAAVNGADTFASKHFYSGFISLYLQNTKWRNSPASPAQIEYLNKYREEDKKLKYGDVTKGKAGDMITKIKFGAKGRIMELVKQKRKEDKAKDAIREWERKADRERVRVGPVQLEI